MPPASPRRPAASRASGGPRRNIRCKSAALGPHAQSKRDGGNEDSRPPAEKRLRMSLATGSATVGQ